jgi:hypothetical protein
MAQQRVIYIHGFNSSPQSFKAQQFGEYLKRYNVDYQVPVLNHEPKQILIALENLLTSDTVLMGSSLGGYFATFLSQQYQLPAVVINPAVAPFKLMQTYLGEQYNPYQNYSYSVTHQHVADLKQLYLAQLAHPELLFLLQQMGDEILDFSEAVDYYKNCRQRVEFAGNHSFIGFERYFPDIVDFLKIS